MEYWRSALEWPSKARNEWEHLLHSQSHEEAKPRSIWYLKALWIIHFVVWCKDGKHLFISDMAGEGITLFLMPPLKLGSQEIITVSRLPGNIDIIQNAFRSHWKQSKQGAITVEQMTPEPSFGAREHNLNLVHERWRLLGFSKCFVWPGWVVSRLGKLWRFLIASSSVPNVGM